MLKDYNRLGRVLDDYDVESVLRMDNEQSLVRPIIYFLTEHADINKTSLSNGQSQYELTGLGWTIYRDDNTWRQFIANSADKKYYCDELISENLEMLIIK